MINPNTRILIVDDQDLVGDILRAMLAAMGVTQVEQAKDGWDALLRLRTEAFDLALVDLNLGSMSGLQLLRAIRRDDQLRQMLVVMITADRSDEVVAEAKASLVNAILHKPFGRNDLGRVIEGVFRTWRPQPSELSEDAMPMNAPVSSGISGRSQYLDRQ